MNRHMFAVLALLVLAPAARAQDMPLAQILIDGEGWKQAESAAPRPASSAPMTKSPDGSTTFQWSARSSLFIHARQTGAPDAIPFAPYCPLRVPAGEPPSVTLLTTDRDGRIYAATPLGVQVFDPTGRLCGIVTLPAAGIIHHLRFEGDRLIAWIGDQKYIRKLKTAGVK